MNEPDKPSFWRSMRMVGWGFLGIRKRSAYQQDLAQVNPLYLIVAALVGVLVFVLVLLGIASWVAGGTAG